MYVKAKEAATNDESGIYLLFVAIALTSLLTLLALGADLGKMYVESLRQQRSADAGAIAAAFEIRPSLTKAEIEDVARRVAWDNFIANNVDYEADPLTNEPTSTSIAAAYDNISTIAVDTNAKFHTLFFGRAVVGTKLWNLPGRAVGQRRPVEVTLVMDVTGSMKEYTDSSCEGICGKVDNPPLSCPTHCVKAHKLSALKAAAKSFVTKFDPAKDRISLVQFAEEARVIHPLDVPYDPVVLQQRIDGLKTLLYTNIQRGLRQGREEAIKHPIPDAKQVLVIVTDGAPNRWNPPALPPINYSTTVLGISPNTYVAYEGKKRVGGGGFPLDAGVSMAGTCGDSVVSSIITAAGETSNSDTIQRVKAQIFSIREADRLRSDNVLVYAIGIGPTDTVTSRAFQTITGDPNVRDVHIKRFMLRRVANDSPKATGDVQYPATCVQSYSDIASTPRGEFLESPEAEDLIQMLNRVAKSIQTRLIE